MQVAAHSARKDGTDNARESSERLARWLTIGALVAIVLVGLALRWDRLQYAEYTADQAWVLNRAYDFVTKGDFPLAGIRSSVGTSQGPIEIYLLAIPVAISKDPRIASAFVGLLQMLAVVGTYFLTSRYFGRAAGLAAAALFALNPWALQYARKVWTPNLMPLFTVFLFMSLFGAVVDRKRYQFGPACMWFVVLFLIHPAAVVFAPVLLIVFAVFWRRIGLRPLILGIGLSFVVALPFLIHEAQNGFISFLIYAGVGSGGGEATIDLEALKYIVTMASGRYFPIMMGYGIRGDWLLPDLSVQNDLATALLALGLGLSLYHVGARIARRDGAQSEWEKYFLLALWLAMPVIASARHSMILHPHYFVGVYPGQFITIAVAVVAIAALAARALRLPAVRGWAVAGITTTVVLYIGLSQAIYFHRYIDYIERQGPTGPYGVPLNLSQEAIDNLREIKAQLGDVPVYTYSYLQRQALAFLARPDLQLREIEPPVGLVLPEDPARGAVLMLASDDAAIAEGRRFNLVDENGETMRRLKEFGFVELEQYQVRGPDGYLYYRFFQLPPGTSEGITASFTSLEAEPALENGMRLRGHSYQSTAKPGDKVTLALLWELPDAPPSYVWKEFNLYVHLTDRFGNSLAAYDSEVFQYMAWRSDDLYISYHEVEVPAERGPELLWFNVGSYSRFDRADVPWVDANGQPVEGTVRIGPLKVNPGEPQAPSVRSDATYDGLLRLTGADVVRPGEGQERGLGVTLHWQALQTVGRDYVVSVQVLGPDGALLAQHDAPPADGGYPTSAWEEGETVLDTHLVALPADAAPAEYGIYVIVYAADTHERLPVTIASGASGDALPLTTTQLP